MIIQLLISFCGRISSYPWHFIISDNSTIRISFMPWFTIILHSFIHSFTWSFLALNCILLLWNHYSLMALFFLIIPFVIFHHSYRMIHLIIRWAVLLRCVYSSASSPQLSFTSFSVPALSFCPQVDFYC